MRLSESHGPQLVPAVLALHVPGHQPLGEVLRLVGAGQGRGRLGGQLQERRRVLLPRGGGQGLAAVGESLLVGVEGGGALRRFPQRGGRPPAQLLRLLPVGGGPGAEVVAGDDSRGLVVAEALEVVGGAQVPIAPLGPGEPPVGDFADE